jgi:(4-O-methyl)-D-glucuronate---lignin esterase
MAIKQRSHFSLVANFTLVALLWLVSASDCQADESGLPSPADLSAQSGLVDPLVMLDGRKVTTREMWIKERRGELIRLFQHYMYGQLPPKPKEVSGKVERVDVNFFDGKATLSEVTIRFGAEKIPPIHLMLVVPNKRTVPAPVILGMNYFGNHTLVRDRRVRLADNWMPERRGCGGEPRDRSQPWHLGGYLAHRGSDPPRLRAGDVLQRRHRPGHA